MKNRVVFRPNLRELSEQARRQIEQDVKRLSECLAAGKPVSLRLSDGLETEIALPVTTAEMIREALSLERDGKSFLLLEEDDEVSPEKAAEMLRISRPTLLKKLDNGEIPFHYVGSHRRITVTDVLAYRHRQKEQAQAALQQMRDEADELGIYE
ncbi:MAG: excisionase family DNA-binding protein [Acidobacteria bacterium]|nr:excisionase family DNA-binding protein [Acidobacteriota bacterium]